jgi:hypothetical protein
VLQRLVGQSLCPRDVAAHVGDPRKPQPSPGNSEVIPQILIERPARQITLLSPIDVPAFQRHVAQKAQKLRLLIAGTECAGEMQALLDEG